MSVLVAPRKLSSGVNSRVEKMRREFVKRHKRLATEIRSGYKRLDDLHGSDTGE